MMQTEEERIEAMSQEFEKAFLTSGLRPSVGLFGDGRGHGCAITAMDVAANGRWANNNSMITIRGRVAYELDKLFPPVEYTDWYDFIDGVMTGFDGPPCRGNNEYTLGCKVGYRVRERMLSKAVEEKAVPAEVIA
jgi:hypothetical protein